MVIDDTEAAALVLADFGESLTVDGVAVTGTFVLGAARADEQPAGLDRRRQATVRLPTTVTVSMDSQIVRASDSSYWHVVAAPDVEYGEQVCLCEAAERMVEGRF